MRTSVLIHLWPTAVIVVSDQLTKAWVRSGMSLGKSVPVLGEEFFRLTHIENTGVAFGLKAGSPIFLILFSIIAAIFLIYLLLKSDNATSVAHPKPVRFSLSLILGGAIGNLIDRVAFGQVTDFLDFDFPDFIMQRWPVFNVADSAVTIGVTIWCIYLIFGKHGSPAPQQTVPTNR